MEAAEEEKKIDKRMVRITENNADAEIFYEERAVLLQVRRGKKRHPLIKNLRHKFRGILKFADLDCKKTKNRLICDHVFPVSNYPSLRLYPHGGDKKESKKVFSKAAEMDDLTGDIVELFPDLKFGVSGTEHFG